MNVVKGNVSVISKDPPCKGGNARITTIPLIWNLYLISNKYLINDIEDTVVFLAF